MSEEFDALILNSSWTFVFPNTTFLFIYVNDLIIIGTSSKQAQRVIISLAHHFSLKDLGALKYFRRVEIISTSSSLFLSQYKYIHDLLAKTNMFGATAISTPFSVIVSFLLHNGVPPDDPTKYHQVIASMQYLFLTRHDISFVINKLS